MAKKLSLALYGKCTDCGAQLYTGLSNKCNNCQDIQLSTPSSLPKATRIVAETKASKKKEAGIYYDAFHKKNILYSETKIVNKIYEEYDFDIESSRSIWRVPETITAKNISFILSISTRLEINRLYQDYILGNDYLINELQYLKGGRLGCICKGCSPAILKATVKSGKGYTKILSLYGSENNKDMVCHGDVLIDLIKLLY